MLARFSASKYFKRFDGHGNGLIIKGRVRSGKTILASMLARNLLFSGFAVISNLRFKNEVYGKYPGRLFYIQNDIQYFEAYISIPDETPIVLVWDDAQAREGFKSTGVMSEQGKKLASFLIFIGKFQTNYIFIAHQKYIPNAILEGFDPLIIYKFKRESFILSDKLYENDKEIHKDNEAIFIPQPKLTDKNHFPVLSRGLADFEFRLDLDALYRHCGKFEYGEDLKQAVTDYLETYEVDDDDPDADLKALSYKRIYMALCIKKGRILSDGEILRDLINPGLISEARRELRKRGFE